MKHIFFYFINIFFGLFIAIVIAVCFAVATKCDHTETITAYSFQSEKSTANSYYKTYCKDCYETLHTTIFRGNPDNFEYLDVLESCSAEGEIVGGKYCTVTATVTLADYDHTRTRLSCKVENENIKVGFSVDFQPEFEELVSLIDEDDTITFYGKYYVQGCGFKDCILIADELIRESD